MRTSKRRVKEVDLVYRQRCFSLHVADDEDDDAGVPGQIARFV